MEFVKDISWVSLDTVYIDGPPVSLLRYIVYPPDGGVIPL
jgi:hypothetical protein